MSDVKARGLATWRQLLAELMGTALLVTVVVGSGIAAARLSPSDDGLQPLENSTATVVGLAVLILVFGPVSGGHFNPVRSAADWLLTRRPGNGLSAGGVARYGAAQLVGAILGALLANIMFDLPALQISGIDRITLGHGLGEIVATAGLVLLVFALARTGRAAFVGGRGRRLYWRSVLVHQLHVLREPGSDGWPDLLRYIRRYRAGVGPVLHRRPACRRARWPWSGQVLPDAPVTAGRAVVPHPNHLPEEG